MSSEMTVTTTTTTSIQTPSKSVMERTTTAMVSRTTVECGCIGWYADSDGDGFGDGTPVYKM